MRLLFLFCLIVVCVPSFASRLVRIAPITDKILMLHFDDGYVQYHGINQDWQQDRVVQSPLNTGAASQSGSYLLSSTDDPAYAQAKSPVSAGRKSKGMDWSAAWPDYPFVREHWIYLELPTPLQRGKTYQIQTGNLAENGAGLSFTFDEFTQRTESIHVNQLGYVPAAGQKYGYVYHWMGDKGPLNLDAYQNTPFHLVRVSDGQIRFSGKMTLRKRRGSPQTENKGDVRNTYAFYAADVWECNFSGFQEPGEYRLVVEKIGCSYPFVLSRDAFWAPYYTTIRGLFHQRSGPARTSEHSEWPKPADHLPGVNGFTVTYSTRRYMDGDNAFDDLPAKSTGQLMPQAWGGWRDAADFDRRNVHMSISNQLLLVYELAPENFLDKQLRLPESGNGIPDIIDEAKWGIDLFRRLKGPTGGICGGLESNGHPNTGKASWNDDLKWFAYGEEPLASFLLAASAAHLAHALEVAGIIDSTALLLTDARSAYQWATANLKPAEATYAAVSLRMFASAALYLQTGETQYQDQFLKDHATRNYGGGRIDPDDEWLLWAAYMYLLCEHPSVNTSVKTSLRNALLATADFLAWPARERACRFGGNYWSPVIVGRTVSTPEVFPLIMAYELSGNEEWMNVLLTSCDYILGGNPLNTVWVTGLGDNPVQNVASLDAWYDGIDSMIPGIVPYGISPVAWSENGGNSFTAGYLQQNAYPQPIRDWPEHEMYFQARHCWINSEFTVHQNIGPAAATYAYLFSKHAEDGVVSGRSQLRPQLRKLDWEVEYFPNPARSELTIRILSNRADSLQIAIRVEWYDTSGKLVRTHVSQGSSLHLSISDVPPGIYSLKIWKGTEWQSKKLLVE